MIRLSLLLAESSILNNAALKDITSKLISEFGRFIERGPIANNTYNYSKKLAFDIDGIKFNVWLLIYTDRNKDPNVQKYPSIRDTAAYCLELEGGDRLVTIFLDDIFNLNTKYNIDAFLNNKDIRDGLYHRQKSEIDSTLAHEAAHVVKGVMYSYRAKMSPYRKYYAGNKNDRTIVNYSKLGSEFDSILSEIMQQLKVIADEDTNESFYYCINRSYIFRKFMLSMLDQEKMWGDYESNKLNNKVFLAFPTKKIIILDPKANPFSAEVINYIQPKHMQLFKKYTQKLVDWWNKTYPKRPLK